MSLQFARNLAEKIIEEHHGDALPIDVKSLAKKFNMIVVAEGLENDVSGLLIKRDSHSFCIVNSSDVPARQRFTIAHELGHLLLRHYEQEGEHVHVDRGNFIMQRGPRSSEGIDPKEVEANQFAASLLMPEGMLRKIIGKSSGAPTDAHVEELSKRFGVSEQAMTIRLVKLGFL